jgi:hypothetical protein
MAQEQKDDEEKEQIGDGYLETRTKKMEKR